MYHFHAHNVDTGMLRISMYSSVCVCVCMVACTSQPVAFDGHPSTCGRPTGLSKSRPINIQQWCSYWYIFSLFIDGVVHAIDDETSFWWWVLAKQVTHHLYLHAISVCLLTLRS